VALFGLGVGDIAEAQALGLSAALGLAFGGTVLLLTDRPKQKASVRDALAVTLLIWPLCAMLASAPFMSAQAGSTPLSGVFEAMSCLTTTGYSLYDPAVFGGLSDTLLLWRAVLHIFGAIITLTIVASVFAGLNLGGPGIHRTRLFTVPETSFFDGLPKVLRMSSALVIMGCVVVTAALIAAGTLPRDALAGAVSTVTTGLVDPAGRYASVIWSPPQAMILSAGLVFGVFGLLWHEWHLSPRAGLTAVRDPEALTFAGAFILVSGLVFLSGVPIIDAAGWSLSSIATSGLALSDVRTLDRIPLVLVLFPVLIGGSALSAAGGLKLARLALLSRRVGMEFRQLGYRQSVHTLSFRARRQSEMTVMGVWVYLVGYIVASALGVLVASVAGLTFSDALLLTIGSVSNAGHVLDRILGDMTGALQLFSLLGMVLGRLEVIALIPVLSADFWRR
ncbi:MAG: hypothetical protein AAGF20_12270, partial [Pseudomonadota bacterium]